MYLNASLMMSLLFFVMGLISFFNASYFAVELRYSYMDQGPDGTNVLATQYSIADLTPANFTPVRAMACSGHGFAATVCSLGGWGAAPITYMTPVNQSGLDWKCGMTPESEANKLFYSPASILADPVGLGANYCVKPDVRCKCFPGWKGGNCSEYDAATAFSPPMVLPRYLSQVATYPLNVDGTPSGLKPPAGEKLFNETFYGWCRPSHDAIQNATLRNLLSADAKSADCNGNGDCTLRPFAGGRNYTYSFCACSPGWMGEKCNQKVSDFQDSIGRYDMSAVTQKDKDRDAYCTKGAVPSISRDAKIIKLLDSTCGIHGVGMKLPTDASGKFTQHSSYYRPQTEWVCHCEPGFTGEQCLGGQPIPDRVSAIACATSVMLAMGGLFLYRQRKALDAHHDVLHITPSDFSVFVDDLPELTVEDVPELKRFFEKWGPVHSVGPAFDDEMLRWYQAKLNDARRLELVTLQLEEATGKQLPFDIHAEDDIHSHSHRDWELRMKGYFPPLPPGGAMNPLCVRIMCMPTLNDMLGMSRGLLHSFMHGAKACVEKELQKDGVRTFSRAFVTFEKAADAEKVDKLFVNPDHKRLSCCLWDWNKYFPCCCAKRIPPVVGGEEALFRDKALMVRPAPEPVEVLWESLDTLPKERNIREWVSTALNVVFLVITFLIISQLPTNADGAVAVLCNLIVTALNIGSAYWWWTVVAYWEQQETEGARMRSVFFKTLLTQLVINVAANVGVSGVPLDSKNGYLPDFYIGQSGYMLRQTITEALVPPILSMGAFAWRAFLVLYGASPSKDLVEWVYEPPTFLLAERCASFMRVVIVVCAFGSGQPLLNFFASGCLMCNYLSDRYVLTYIFKNAPAGSELPRAIEFTLSMGSFLNIVLAWLTLRDGSSDSVAIRAAMFAILSYLLWAASGYFSFKWFGAKDCFGGNGCFWTGGLCCYSRIVMAPVEWVNSCFLWCTFGKNFFLDQSQVVDETRKAMKKANQLTTPQMGASTRVLPEQSLAGVAKKPDEASEDDDETGGRTYTQISEDTPLWELQKHPYCLWERAQLGTYMSRKEIYPTMPPLTACEMADLRASILDDSHHHLPNWLMHEIKKSRKDGTA